MDSKRFNDTYCGFGRVRVSRDPPRFAYITATGRLCVKTEPDLMYASELELHHFDTHSNSREYWNGVAAFLRWLNAGLPSGYGDWHVAAYKRLRALRHEAQAKYWDTVLPREIVAWAYGVLERETSGLDCVDNFRVARLGNTGQMRRYKAQVKAGCCGSTDFIETGPDGQRYLLGANFGH